MSIQKKMIGALIFSCLFFANTKSAQAKSYESAPSYSYQSGGHNWTDWFHWFKAKHRTRRNRTNSRGSNTGGDRGSSGGSRGQGHPTPEPVSLGLISLATLGLGWGIRKKKPQIES